MTNAADPTSLAAWLQQYNRAAPIASLQSTIDLNQHLADTLGQLRDQKTRELEQHEAERSQLALAQRKIHTLRESLSHFSSHANSLSDRLVRAESAAVEERQRNTVQTSQIEEERNGFKALCLVWEARWREERTAREEAEDGFRKSQVSFEKRLNGQGEREETRVVMQKGISTKSRTRSPRPPSTEAWKNASPSGQRSLNAESVITELADEISRLRAELKDTIHNRDTEVARLEAEVRLRRSEMNQLYSSLDQLSFLPGASSTSQTGHNVSAQQTRTFSRRQGSKTAVGSVLELPAVQAAASHSRSRRPSNLTIGQQTVGDIGETLRLEEEIREMERKIRLLSGEPESEDSSAEPADGSALPAELDASVEDGRGSMRIDTLSRELEAVKRELETARREKALLERELDEVSCAISDTPCEDSKLM
ncbi:hypothetical protein JCM11491_003901 [Sporobolomyces phaffii]